MRLWSVARRQLPKLVAATSCSVILYITAFSRNSQILTPVDSTRRETLPKKLSGPAKREKNAYQKDFLLSSHVLNASSYICVVLLRRKLFETNFLCWLRSFETSRVTRLPLHVVLFLINWLWLSVNKVFVHRRLCHASRRGFGLRLRLRLRLSAGGRSGAEPGGQGLSLSLSLSPKPAPYPARYGRCRI